MSLNNSDDEKTVGIPPGEDTDNATVMGDKETSISPASGSPAKGGYGDDKRERDESPEEDFDIEAQEVMTLYRETLFHPVLTLFSRTT